MAYTQADHPIFQDVIHHPVVVLVVAIVLAVAVLSLIAGGPSVEPGEIEGFIYVP